MSTKVTVNKSVDLIGGVLYVNGVPYIPPASDDDQQLSVDPIDGSLDLEDGGSVPGMISTDLAGNVIGTILNV